ncbi:DUF6659 family protein [Nitrosopumilus sp. S4]
MQLKQIHHSDIVCNQLRQIPGIRFVAIINKRGRKISGGFSPKITPFEKDEQKLEMLFMEISLDFSMRSEFNNSLGEIQAIVSFRDKTTIITIPYEDNLILLSVEPEFTPSKVIQIVQDKFCFEKESICKESGV